MVQLNRKILGGICLVLLFAAALQGIVLSHPQLVSVQDAYSTLRESRVWRSPEIQASVGNFTEDTNSSFAIYQPDPGWTPWIVDFEKSVEYGKTGASFEYLQANSSYISVEELKRSNEQLKSFLFDYKDSSGNFVDAEGYLKNKMDQYYYDSQSFATTHKTIKINIQAIGQGQFSDKTSKIAGRLYVEERCVGQPSIPGHVGKMESELKSILYPYAVVCIRNPTRVKIPYQIKYGNGDWESYPGNANRSRTFAWRYAVGSLTSPVVSIRFDSSFASGFQEQIFKLNKYAAPSSADCSKGYNYRFGVSGENIRLYDSED